MKTKWVIDMPFLEQYYLPILRSTILVSYLMMAVEVFFLPIPSEASTRALVRRKENVPASLLSYAVIPMLFGVPLLWSLRPTWYRYILPLADEAAFGSPSIATGATLLVLLGTILTGIGTATLKNSGRENPDRLVTRGVFRFSRNPITLGLHIAVLGYLLAVPSLISAIGLPLFLRHMNTRIRIEEAHLFSRFGAVYGSYCAMVGRYGPRWGRPHTDNR